MIIIIYDHEPDQRLLCRTLAGNSVHLLTISSPEALEDHKVAHHIMTIMTTMTIMTIAFLITIIVIHRNS